MSVNASQPELLQLILRHLKEFGFHSAANELQRHSPQGECSMSASLLEIYSSWLNDPKGKAQSPSAKASSLNKKGRTPAKGSKSKAISPTKAGNKSSSDNEELSQSLLPQTLLKSCPTTPAKVMASPRSRKENPAVLVSPGTTVVNDSTTTIDIQTPKVAKHNDSGKDPTGSTNKVKGASKKQAKSPKTKGKSHLKFAESAAAVTTGKKKDKAKAETAKKKPDAVKRKAPASKDGANVPKTKKTKTQMKDVVAAGGGVDSDSDSSLDVEKWKKLVLDMTDADVVKMDVINALDSSTPLPKRRIVRKPATSKERTVEDKSKSNTPAKNATAKKSRTNTPAAETPPADPHREQNISSEKERPAIPTVSASEQNGNGVTLSEESTEGPTSGPKTKKKKKKKEVKGDKDREEEMKTGSEAIGQLSEDREDNALEDQTVIVHHNEVPDSVVPEPKKDKKAKKKKKEKSEQDEDQVNSEQMSERANDGAQKIMSPKKKKKKKDKTDVDNSEVTEKDDKIIPAEASNENSNLADEERKTERKGDESDLQDPSQQIFKKKKRKKDKADRDETIPELGKKDQNEIAELNNSVHNDSAPLCPETPRTEKKKKKSKLKLTDVSATPKSPSPDSKETSHHEVFFQPPSVIHKKKKKSFKKSSSEDT